MRYEAEDHRNVHISLLIWRSNFFELPENPGRYDPDSQNLRLTCDEEGKLPQQQQ
jgi:hypothetical protein